VPLRASFLRKVAFPGMPLGTWGKHPFPYLKINKFSFSLILVWGEGMRRALKNWYGNMSDKQFAELLAFRNRKYSWSHRDVLKLIHFKAPNPGMHFFCFQHARVTQKKYTK